MHGWHSGWDEIGKGVLGLLAVVILVIAAVGVAVGVCIGAAIWA